MKYKPTRHRLVGRRAVFETDVGDFIELILAYNKSRDYVGSAFDSDAMYIYDLYRYKKLQEAQEIKTN